MNKNLQAYLKLESKGSEGKYVVLVEGEVVAKGKDLVRMLARVRRQYPGKVPCVAKVPEEGTMILSAQ